ncbi:MAG: hypothetical protein ISS46_03605 [Candidatus Omnitrophica bacterium]|nr:hypothetical protein [Candidatus Omnitrophota bacterium]
MQTCPHCKNLISDDEALRCLFCGDKLNQPAGFLSSFKYFKGRNIAIFIGVVVLAAFLMWFL